MEWICLLKSDVNQCQYLGENQKCNAPDSKCGMLVKLKADEPEKDPYVRQPRWYEKYYQ